MFRCVMTYFSALLYLLKHKIADATFGVAQIGICPITHWG